MAERAIPDPRKYYRIAHNQLPVVAIVHGTCEGLSKANEQIKENEKCYIHVKRIYNGSTILKLKISFKPKITSG